MLRRGQIIQAEVGSREPKLFVVVSNSTRNRLLDQVLAARLTTSAKRERPSIVELGSGEAFTGRVVCDDIEPIWPDEVHRVLGGLTPRAMRAVDDGLMAALGIER